MISQVPEQLVYQRPRSLTDCVTNYCPGCTHGVAHRLVAEVIDELGIRERTIGVAPVGCAVFAYNYFDCDFVVAAHGRAPAMATGLKRVRPDAFIFTNNAIYGMTGGQMAPTSLVGMPTTSSPSGRNVGMMGYPIKVCELLAQIDGAAFVARRSLHNPAEIRKAKKAIRRAFENQLAGVGFSLVELLSSCPTNWGLTPADALKWIATEMLPVYALGEFKNVSTLER